MTMSVQVASVLNLANYHLVKIGRARRLLTEDTTKMAIYSSVTSRLDYCNSLLVGISQQLCHSLDLDYFRSNGTPRCDPGCPAVTANWCYLANYIVGPLLRVAELLSDDSATLNFSVGVLLVIREKYTPEIQLKMAFIEIDGQPMMMLMIDIKQINVSWEYSPVSLQSGGLRVQLAITSRPCEKYHNLRRGFPLFPSWQNSPASCGVNISLSYVRLWAGQTPKLIFAVGCMLLIWHKQVFLIFPACVHVVLIRLLNKTQDRNGVSTCNLMQMSSRQTYIHVQIPPHGVPSQLRTGEVLHRVATRVLRNGRTLQPLPHSYCVGTRQRGAVLQRSLALTL